jgi:signal transduction histidine kinase
LFFGHANVGVFGEREEQLTRDIAAHAAIALENARLYEAERHARAEAEAAVRARDEFLGIASHELRNPLAGLKAAVQLLVRWRARGPVDGERQDRFLAEISRATDRLAGLLEDLLDVSRLRTVGLQIRPELTDLAELVRDTAAGFRAEAPERPIQLASVAADYRVLIDPDRIRQVLANLLSNALKYSPDGGPVQVELSVAPDQGVLVHVRDTGIGLPALATESIFEPFGRAPNAHARNIPGMGLGLYICRQIVLSHGGRIRAESAGEGRGTTVCMWLPRSGAQDA